METEENESLYDELRENILKMFSLKKHINKKENVFFCYFIDFFNRRKNY